MPETSPPPDPQQQIKDLRQKVLDSFLEVEKARYNEGFDEGFNAGWDACARRIAASLQAQAEQKPPEPPTPPQQPAVTFSYADQPSNTDLVLQVIKNQPGLKGVEIADLMDNTAFTIPERTVRTCLHRLKKAGKIEVVDGRWYTTEYAMAQEAARKLNTEE